MRDSNHSFPALNRACVSISSSLYDRRAIDSPVPTLPLVTSLQHLAYLTSTSPRIREILTLDGGLERLIAIVDTCLDIAYPERARQDRKGSNVLGSQLKGKGREQTLYQGQAKGDDDENAEPVITHRKPMIPFKAFSAYAKYPFSLDSDESEGETHSLEDDEQDVTMDGSSSDPDTIFNRTRSASKRRTITRSRKITTIKSIPASSPNSRMLELHAREARLLAAQRDFTLAFVNEYKDLPALVHTYGFALQCLVNVGVRGSEAIRTRVVESGVLAVVARILGGFLDYRGHEREKRAKILNVHHHSSSSATASTNVTAQQGGSNGHPSSGNSSRRAALRARERERDTTARATTQFAYSNIITSDLDGTAQSSSAPPTAVSNQQNPFPIATPLVAGMAAPQPANAPSNRAYTFEELVATAPMPPAQRSTLLTRSSASISSHPSVAPPTRASSASGSTRLTASPARSSLTSSLLDASREIPTQAVAVAHRGLQQHQQQQRPGLFVAGGLAPRRTLSAAPGIPLHLHGLAHLPGSRTASPPVPGMGFQRTDTPDTIASQEEVQDFSDANPDENESTSENENDGLIVSETGTSSMRTSPSNASTRPTSLDLDDMNADELLAAVGTVVRRFYDEVDGPARQNVDMLDATSRLSRSANSVASSNSSSATLASAVLPATSSSMVGDLTIKMVEEDDAGAPGQSPSQVSSHGRSLSHSDEDGNTASQSDGGDMDAEQYGEDIVMTGAADNYRSASATEHITPSDARRSLRLQRREMLSIAALAAADAVRAEDSTDASTSASPVEVSFGAETLNDNETTPVSRTRPLQMSSIMDPGTAETVSAEMSSNETTIIRPTPTSGHYHHHHNHSRVVPPAVQIPHHSSLAAGVQPSAHVQLRLHPQLGRSSPNSDIMSTSARDLGSSASNHLLSSCGPLMDHYVKEEDVLHCLHLLAYLSKYPHVRAVFHDPENELCRTSSAASQEMDASSCTVQPTDMSTSSGPQAATLVDKSNCCSCARKKLRCGEKPAASTPHGSTSTNSLSGMDTQSPSSATARVVHSSCSGQCHAHADAQDTEKADHARAGSTGSQKHAHPCCDDEHNPEAVEEAESLARARAMATMPAKDRKPALEPSRPPRSTANNVFSLVEQYTFRPSSPADRSMRLGTDVQYWAGVIMRNACRKDELRGGIRQCANMGCGVWERFPREFAKCRRCRKAKYCSKGCQRRAWQAGHRYWCSARQDTPPAQAAGAGAVAAAAQEGGEDHHDDDHDDEGHALPHQHHHPHQQQAQNPQMLLGPGTALAVTLEGVVDGITVGGTDDDFGPRVRVGGEGGEEMAMLDAI